MIRFGIAGIPLSSKGRTLRDAIEEVHNMGLSALEVQMYRMSVHERAVEEEWVGVKPVEVKDTIIVDLLRPDEEGEYRSVGISTPMEEGDVALELYWNLAKNYEEISFLGEVAKELDVKLTLHTPHYMDLISNTYITERSINHLIWCGQIAHRLQAEMVVTHLGLYGDKSPEEALKAVQENISLVKRAYREYKLKPKIGVENSGKPSVFGTLDEILALARRLKVVPVVNVPHYHAREHGKLKTPGDFEELLTAVEKYMPKKEHYVHYAGVEHEGGVEKRLTMIKKGDLDFEKFADCLLECGFNITIISISPLLEHDASYMRVLLERRALRYLSRKKEKKEQKQKAEKKGKKSAGKKEKKTKGAKK